MPQPSRRAVLTSAVSLTAATALPGPAAALERPLAVQMSALLLEHRRRAAVVLAIEAVDALEPLYKLDAPGLLPTGMTSDEVEALIDQYTSPRDAAIAAHLRVLAPIAREIWATPAATWADIVARAEVVKFWNRGEGYADHHGYDHCLCEMRLIDTVLLVDKLQPELRSFLPAFDAPPALVEWRRLHVEEHELYALRDLTDEENDRYRSARFHLEYRRLLKEPADSSTWVDVVVRAELMGRGNSRSWLDHEGLHCEHRAFAELLAAILRLGNCPPRPDSSDIYWERTNHELWETARAKSRVYHEEVVGLRKAYRGA